MEAALASIGEDCAAGPATDTAAIWPALAAVLAEPDARRKADRARAAEASWNAGEIDVDLSLWRAPPRRPGRPARPTLVDPRHAPRRRLSSAEGRAALLHAVAHIELNAIDLAFDMAARFAPALFALGEETGRAFLGDWIKVGGDEARHFLMIQGRLEALGRSYGDFDAHDGLWEAAEKTMGDPLARLAIAPLILEARGLDVAPGMRDRLSAAGDDESAALLDTIYTDEKTHVAAGVQWFDTLCAARKLEPRAAFHALADEHFPAGLKAPFNEEGRRDAGLLPDFYKPLAR